MEQQIETMKDKLLASIISVLFGVTGLHWFYLRRFWKGLFCVVYAAIVIYLGVFKLLSVTIFFGVWVGFALMRMDYYDFNQLYNRKKFK